eukprot:2502587-Rhodomonas_salina.2
MTRRTLPVNAAVRRVLCFPCPFASGASARRAEDEQSRDRSRDRTARLLSVEGLAAAPQAPFQKLLSTHRCDQSFAMELEPSDTDGTAHGEEKGFRRTFRRDPSFEGLDN